MYDCIAFINCKNILKKFFFIKNLDNSKGIVIIIFEIQVKKLLSFLFSIPKKELIIGIIIAKFNISKIETVVTSAIKMLNDFFLLRIK